MAKIIIVEDQAEHAQRLEQLLMAYQSRHEDCAFTVSHYNNPHRFLSEYACDADLVFLDIQMPGLNGIETAKRLRQVDSKVMLIFTTALAQYAIAGYEVQAFDYILKPLMPDMFFSKLSRALRVLSYSLPEEWIDISTKTETRRVAVNRIRYIEVDDHDIVIHTQNETIRHWGNLREYEQRLLPLHFVRCNICYLVNMKYVQCIHANSVLVDGHELAVSRSKRKDFLTAFAKYKGGSQ